MPGPKTMARPVADAWLLSSLGQFGLLVILLVKNSSPRIEVQCGCFAGGLFSCWYWMVLESGSSVHGSAEKKTDLWQMGRRHIWNTCVASAVCGLQILV